MERFRGIRGFGIDELLSHRSTTEVTLIFIEKLLETLPIVMVFHVKVQKSPLDRLLSMTSHFDAVKKQAGDDGDGDGDDGDDGDGDDGGDGATIR